MTHIREAAREFIKTSTSTPCLPSTERWVPARPPSSRPFAKNWASNDIITSPTFAIVNEYQTKNDSPIYHFDFYRIKKIEEVYDMGYEDYFYSGALCFIEWPELIDELLPDDAVRVSITEDADGSRTVTF